MTDSRWLAKATRVDPVERNGAVYLRYGYRDVIGEDGELAQPEIPGKYEICDLCDGKGRHVNPNVDDEGIAAWEFDEDPDFRESYFSGVYDVACYQCSGQRVMVVPDEARCSREQLKEFNAHMKAMVEMYEEEEQERRMGA